MDANECETHAALSAAGVVVDVISEEAFHQGAADGADLVLLVRPSAELRDRVRERTTRTEGRLLITKDRVGAKTIRSGWGGRRLTGVSPRFSAMGSPHPRHRRRRWWRVFPSSSPFSGLMPEEAEEVLVRWGRSGPPALVGRTRGGFRCWRSGFSLDHLTRDDVVRLLGILADGAVQPKTFRSPVPTTARAVVLLLHDVEEPLAEDPRGTRSVIDGIETCLEAEAKYGYHATYNIVGRFGDTIPDLVRRIASEGHELASHSATHQVMADLPLAALCTEVIDAEASIARNGASKIKGFRSPRSRWSADLLDCLAKRGYLWNSEADASPFPYRIPRGMPGSLLRIAVAVDDWDYVKRRATPKQMLRTWMQEVRWALDRRCWVGIGSHPSVLGADRGRLAAFSDFLAWLADESVEVMTHCRAGEWWLRRLNGAEDSPGQAEARFTMRRS